MELDQKLSELKNSMLEMGGHVEKALTQVILGLLKKDIATLNSVHEIEKSINHLQVKIDSSCLSIIAQQGPVAKDLRLILSVIKMNTDLERMGDQCVNMAHLGREFLERSKMSSDSDKEIQIADSMNDIQKMAENVKFMVKAALDSFVRLDTHAAQQVLMLDDEIDGSRNRIFQKCVSLLKSNSNLTESCLDLILISRNLERIGDHATNIAEDIIFANTGKDVRHGDISGGN